MVYKRNNVTNVIYGGFSNEERKIIRTFKGYDIRGKNIPAGSVRCFYI